MVGFAHDSEGATNPPPADAVTIPADACGTFHLPPAADTPRPNWREVSDTARQNNSSPPADILHNVVNRRARSHQTTYRDMSSFYKRFYNPLPADAVTVPADARGSFHLPPAAEKRGLTVVARGAS